jgi:hypothetical protein
MEDCDLVVNTHPFTLAEMKGTQFRCSHIAIFSALQMTIAI